MAYNDLYAANEFIVKEAIPQEPCIGYLLDCNMGCL